MTGPAPNVTVPVVVAYMPALAATVCDTIEAPVGAVVPTVIAPVTPTVLSKVAPSSTLKVPLIVVAEPEAPMLTGPAPNVTVPVVVANTFAAAGVLLATISPPPI